MFREIPEKDSSLYAPESHEATYEQLELDENIFHNLSKVEKLVPESERKLYQGNLESIRNFAFYDLEREFNLLLPKPDHSRDKLLDASHEAIPCLARLAEKLKGYGLKVPWINPKVDEQIKLRDEGKLSGGKKINYYRSMEEEQMIKLISTHDSLKQALTYANSKKKVGKLGLSKEQVESTKHIIDHFNNLPPQYKEEFDRLVNDDDFYHESLDRLRQQLDRRLAKKQLVEKQEA
ncbi:MAG: hypothetical protein ABIJ81_04275 [Patescibacteria group bacterium]